MKNKRPLIALIVLFGASFGIIATIAYSMNVTNLSNRFEIAAWKTVFEEKFDAPSNWTTCETIDKEITIKNESDLDAGVRIRLSEQWLANDGTELPLYSSESGTQMAIINYLENSGWTKNEDGYYYYDVDLKKGESSKTLTTGVTLNCDANLDVDTDYVNATYHLKITGQSIQYDRKDQWRTTLYDVVASKSRGGDSRIKFNTFPEGISPYPEKAPGSGKGVFSIASTMNDGFPIHYYRGDVNDNHVIFANKCWHIVRTTETGGVKLAYDSEIVMDGENETCEEYSSGLKTGSTHSYAFNSYPRDDISSASYMFGRDYDGDYSQNRRVTKVRSWTNSDSSTIRFANDVRYENGQYTLVGVVSGTPSSLKEAIFKDHHYFCLDDSASPCAEVGYAYLRNGSITASNGFGIYYFDITGFANMEAKKAAIFANEVNSDIKTVLDGWYEDELADYSSALEDTVFCNDKTMSTGGLRSKDTTIESAVFTASDRLRPISYSSSNYPMTPTLACSKDDSFTVNESSVGNGALTYPIGLLSADEFVYAGVASNYSSCKDYSSSCSKKNYLSNTGSSDIMTMTPFDYSNPTIYRMSIAGTDNPHPSYMYATSGFIVYPSISLKAGTYYKTGNGTITSPYRVE